MSLLSAHPPVCTRSMPRGMKAETQSLGCSPWRRRGRTQQGAPDEAGPLGLAWSILTRLDTLLAVVMGSVSRSFCIFPADREFEQTWKLPLRSCH